MVTKRSLALVSLILRQVGSHILWDVLQKKIIIKNVFRANFLYTCDPSWITDILVLVFNPKTMGQGKHCLAWTSDPPNIAAYWITQQYLGSIKSFLNDIQPFSKFLVWRKWDWRMCVKVQGQASTVWRRRNTGGRGDWFPLFL